MWLWILLVLVVLAFVVWEVWICEGAHLGRHFVIWLYDLLAGRFEAIKQFDADWERHVLGEPLASAISHLGQARVLDVGAGSGRMARALPPVFLSRLRLVAAEPSARMVALGRRLAPLPYPWLRAWSDALPFPGGTFDVVTTLEVLEFTPSPQRALREILRVLRPGGLLLVTNRVGPEASWILGRTVRRGRFIPYLTSFGLTDVHVTPWQVEYDLAWATKS